MTEPKVRRLGVIGLGEGRSILSAARSSTRWEVAGVCDLDETLCRQRLLEFELDRWTTDYDDLLADPLIDAIAIYTPDHLHLDHCVRALEADKHVICTKPLLDSLGRRRPTARRGPPIGGPADGGPEHPVLRADDQAATRRRGRPARRPGRGRRALPHRRPLVPEPGLEHRRDVLLAVELPDPRRRSGALVSAGRGRGDRLRHRQPEHAPGRSRPPGLAAVRVADADRAARHGVRRLHPAGDRSASGAVDRLPGPGHRGQQPGRLSRADATTRDSPARGRGRRTSERWPGTTSGSRGPVTMPGSIRTISTISRPVSTPASIPYPGRRRVSGRWPCSRRWSAAWRATGDRPGCRRSWPTTD